MIYRAIRKLKAVLYHAIVEPDIKRSFAECGKDSHIDSGGDFFPLSNIHVGNHASIGVNARFWTTRAKIYIEDYALFGPGVTIITGDHRKDIIGKHIIELTDADKTAEDDQGCGDRKRGMDRSRSDYFKRCAHRCRCDCGGRQRCNKGCCAIHHCRRRTGTFYKESFLRRSARTAYSNHRRR